MSKKKDEIPDLNVEISDQVKEKIAKDPKLANYLRETIACFRQAHQAVQEGRYASFPDAVEAITGTRPVRIDVDDC